jgi:hypothetical protein
MKLSALASVLKPFCKCEFNVKETMQWLSHNKPMYWSWGVSKLTNLFNAGLLLRVHGHHHNGYVLITLNGGADLYEFRLLKTNGTVIATFEDVYCDDLQEMIDNKIERIAEYIH